MRRERDSYFTSDSATEALKDWLGDDLRGNLLLDPSCGDGRMARSLADRFDSICLNDIHAPTLNEAAHGQGNGPPLSKVGFATVMDACDQAVWTVCPDWTVTNPPFFAAGDIARHALRHSTRGVALLLRCTFAERVGPSHMCRKPRPGKPGIACDPARCMRNGRLWLREFPPTRVLAIPRISFTGDGSTDSAPCWWFVWERRAFGRGWARGTLSYPTAESA